MTADRRRRSPTEIGQARIRKEDARLITGRTSWTDNIPLPGMLHLAIAAQPDRARPITAIDVSAARSAPGVVARLHRPPTSATSRASLPCAWPVTAGHGHPRRTRRWPSTRCSYVGEAVAVVVARDRPRPPTRSRPSRSTTSRCPPVLDMEAALADGAPLVHPDTGHQQVATPGSFDSGDAGTGAARSSAAAENADVDRRQPPLRPAAADPGVHGAALASSSTRPASERHHVVGDPDPAHPAD